jgi:hypothetical protein
VTRTVWTVTTMESGASEGGTQRAFRHVTPLCAGGFAVRLLTAECVVTAPAQGLTPAAPFDCFSASSASSNVRGVQPHGGAVVSPIRHPHIHVAAGPAERFGVDMLLAVVGPNDAGHDRHRLVEGVLGHAGAGVVEDRLSSGLPRGCWRAWIHPPSVEQMFV